MKKSCLSLLGASACMLSLLVIAPHANATAADTVTATPTDTAVATTSPTPIAYTPTNINTTCKVPNEKLLAALLVQKVKIDMAKRGVAIKASGSAVSVKFAKATIAGSEINPATETTSNATFSPTDAAYKVTANTEASPLGLFRCKIKKSLTISTRPAVGKKTSTTTTDLWIEGILDFSK